MLLKLLKWNVKGGGIKDLSIRGIGVIIIWWNVIRQRHGRCVGSVLNGRRCRLICQRQQRGRVKDTHRGQRSDLVLAGDTMLDQVVHVLFEEQANQVEATKGLSATQSQIAHHRRAQEGPLEQKVLGLVVVVAQALELMQVDVHRGLHPQDPHV